MFQLQLFFLLHCDEWDRVVALPETQVCHRSYIISASFLWVSSTNKTDCHYKTEILLKVVLITINQTIIWIVLMFSNIQMTCYNILFEDHDFTCDPTL